MTTLASTNPTLMDWAKQLGPDGKITADIVEMLTQDNEMLLDMTFLEANGPTSHRVNIRTGLPSVTWRQFYQGVPASKNSYAQVDETLGMMEARSLVDAKLAALNGDMGQFRLNEAAGFLEAMTQEMQATVIYGNVSTAATKFNGLSPRYNSLAGAASGENIINCGGTGSDNTSMWLLGWSPTTVFGLFPKGAAAGLQREDLGKQEVLDGSNNRYTALEEKFMWDAGLCVKDWRYAVRAANIDKSDLVAQSSAADILATMTKMVHKVPSLGKARFAFYVNRTIQTMLDIQAQNKSNVYLTVGEEEGKPKISFRGIPIRRVDQLLNSETAVA
jgi:hypothetical protein